MASAKDTFEANTFETNTFACGTWRGIGVDVAVVVDESQFIRRAPSTSDTHIRRTGSESTHIRRAPGSPDVNIRRP